MLIIPAIDILNGSCVRLTRGDFGRVKKYRPSPFTVAKKFRTAGATLLHVVDLNGARAGGPKNQTTILKLARAAKIPVQVGGGIRTFKSAAYYLKNSVYRVVLGTAAVENTSLIKKLLAEFGSDRIAISLDIKNGLVATRGWTQDSALSFVSALRQLKKLRIKNIIVTDITKDGLLRGPNLALAREAVLPSLNITMAGGITTLNDISALGGLGITGAIIGKALYEKKINLATAFKKFPPQTPLTKRIIPCLDIKNGRVVKGVGFKNLRDAGNPADLATYYSKNGADELVFLDITATVEKRRTLLGLVKKIAREINIPFTVGGGIRTLPEIRALLKAGADKVSLGSIAIQNPAFVKLAAKKFGSQCIVISLDVKKQGPEWMCYTHGGRFKTALDAIEFAKKMERLGAGELLVNSLDRDGTGRGYDLPLLKKITAVVNIPVIASSGAGKPRDFLAALQTTNVDAVLAASLFHTKKIKIPVLKKYLQKNNIAIRLT